LLDKEKNDFKKEVLIKSLKHFPEKIYIKDQNRIIFTNDREPDETDTLSLMSFPLNGNDGLTMELSNLSKESISTDLYHSQRISLLGELLNTLQHELSNPLFGLNLTSSLLIHETTDPETLSTLNDIIKNFSNLYNEKEDLKNTNLVSLVEETLTLTKSESKQIRKEVRCINFDSSSGLFLQTNPTYLTQIIFNLIINASQAIKNATQGLSSHRIVIELEEMKNEIVVRVIDDGPGITKNIENEIFRPFFTTKDSGTGLGLSICKNLALELGAEINFKNNSPMPGATFWINLKR
jgi:signal transduction histidine kinase